jgi:D-alanyl-D-alanine carboxypeptidase
VRRPLLLVTASLVVAGVLAASLVVAGSTLPTAIGTMSPASGTPSEAAASVPPTGASSPPAASAQPSVAASAWPSLAPSPSPSPTSDPLPPVRLQYVPVVDARLDRVIARWRSQTGAPGVSVAIIWPGGRIWKGAVGEADAALHVPLTTDTAFAYASVTKTFTAALVLQLVDEGRLSLDDRAAELLPDEGLHPAMTVRDLLDHTSGLNDIFRVTGIEPALNKDIHRVWTEDDALAFGRSDRVPPGTFWRYSNTGYIYLGKILETVTGQSWASLVRERLLDPLRLGHAFVQGAEAPRSPLARGHRLTGSGSATKAQPLGGRDPLVPFTSVVTAAGAAGAVAGTAEDAARWAEALYGGHVLQPATLEAAIADVQRTAVHHPRISYGLGVQVVRYGNQVTWGHSGTFTGFKLGIRWLPDQHVAIAVLTNQNRSELTGLMKQLIVLAGEIKPTSSCPGCL